MPWIQLKLNTTGANAEDLSDALMEAEIGRASCRERV